MKQTSIKSLLGGAVQVQLPIGIDKNRLKVVATDGSSIPFHFTPAGQVEFETTKDSTYFIHVTD